MRAKITLEGLLALQKTFFKGRVDGTKDERITGGD
jgi:hypothetical protein